MSTTNERAGNVRVVNRSFTALMQAAKSEYQRITGQALDNHPFAAQLGSCVSPKDVSNVFRVQARVFSEFRRGEDKLMARLDPIVNILFLLSETLKDGIGLPCPPAKTIFTGIGVLLAAMRAIATNHDTLMHLFERIHFFLRRLNSYTQIPLSDEWTELLGKIIAQILSILAYSTKAMTEKRIKTILKRLIGRTDVEDALQRLDSLTKEECLMAVAENLEASHRVNRNVQGIERVIHRVDQNTNTIRQRTDDLRWGQLRNDHQRWLSPPDPSINHDIACKTKHGGTARWFIYGRTFREWKRKGSLLWIRGNPGAGKTIICSAIINNIKNTRKEMGSLVAYYYFHFNDNSKRDLRGLLASLLFQLCDSSNRCRNVLHELYKICNEGSERPSEAALTWCLKKMLNIPGQRPIFIVMDALDECPSTTGTPSARDEVLNFVEDLVGSNHSNLFVCVTSRPEQDIQTVLNPLTSPSCRVSLHEESGQREDINVYVRSFVQTDRAMRRWREEDKELVINALSERAGGMFRWVFCQLDTLRRCFPSSIRRILNRLPPTLDETYERMLDGIPKEKRQHAHRLFQCLIAAIRPLHVKELAEIFAVEFDIGTAPNLMEGWRCENPEEAILSACSTLITVVDDSDSKIVQFSHFSVREFLTSERLQTCRVEDIRHYHIPLDTAHTTLAQACLTVLLKLDEKTNKKRLTTFPLAFYAAQHWFTHAKHEGVAPQVRGAMEQLFNPNKPYLAAWVWIHDVDLRWVQRSIDTIDTLADHPSLPGATSLYYAVSCGLCGVAKYLISTYGEDVNAKCGTYGSPLHAASSKGHIDAVSLLLDHGADVNMVNTSDRTPLCVAYDRQHLETMHLLLECGAAADVQYNSHGLLIHSASYSGRAEAVRLLLQHDADVNATARFDYTSLHWASTNGHANIAQILLEHGANIDAQSDFGTPLYLASFNEHLGVALTLLERGADVHIRAPQGWTPFQVARRMGQTNVAQLLLEHGAKKE